MLTFSDFFSRMLQRYIYATQSLKLFKMIEKSFSFRNRPLKKEREREREVRDFYKLKKNRLQYYYYYYITNYGKIPCM